MPLHSKRPSRLRRLIQSVPIIVLLLGLSTFANSAERTGLWHVVQQCVLLQRLTNLTFPCTAVEQPHDGSVGSVLLKSPRSKTEFLLMPAVAILGIEDPAVRTPSATALWQKAWADRSEIDTLIGRQLPREDIGLAVNSETTRTQDQLHIHIECTSPRVAQEVAAIAPLPEVGWQGPQRIGTVDYWLMSVEADDLSTVDVIGRVAALVSAHSESMAATNITVLGATLPGGRAGFYILANTTNQPSEDLLDHDCAAANQLP